MKLTEEDKEWATETLKETPYWRDGMTVDEYEVERKYLYEDFGRIREGTYKPLWVQGDTKQVEAIRNRLYDKIYSEIGSMFDKQKAIPSGDIEKERLNHFTNRKNQT